MVNSLSCTVWGKSIIFPNEKKNYTICYFNKFIYITLTLRSISQSVMQWEESFHTYSSLWDQNHPQERMLLVSPTYIIPTVFISPNVIMSLSFLAFQLIIFSPFVRILYMSPSLWKILCFCCWKIGKMKYYSWASRNTIQFWKWTAWCKSKPMMLAMVIWCQYLRSIWDKLSVMLALALLLSIWGWQD